MMLDAVSSNFMHRFFMCTVASGLFLFCVAVTIISSRQHMIKYEYSIGTLENACSSYERKILELDRKFCS
jgi:hypothetical protein